MGKRKIFRPLRFGGGFFAPTILPEFNESRLTELAKGLYNPNRVSNCTEEKDDMATAEEIERVLALLRASAPGERYREVGSTAMGIGAVLLFLHRAEEPVSAGQISHFMNVSTARVAVLLKKMEGKGLICTGRSAADGRVTTVRISRQGEDVFLRMERELHNKIAYLIERVGMERLVEFARISDEIQAALSELPEPLLRNS